MARVYHLVGMEPITPSSFYATYNPLDKTAEITLSNGDRSCTGSGSVWRAVRGTVTKSAGKYYAEFTTDEIHTSGFTSSSICGLATTAFLLSTYVGSDTQSWGIQAKGSSTQLTTWYNTTGTLQGTGVDVAGITRVAVDFDAGKIWMGRVNDWMGGGDPAAGTGELFTFTPNTPLLLATSCYDDQMDTTLNAGQAAWGGTPPTGYAGWLS